MSVRIHSRNRPPRLDFTLSVKPNYQMRLATGPQGMPLFSEQKLNNNFNSSAVLSKKELVPLVLSEKEAEFLKKIVDGFDVKASQGPQAPLLTEAATATEDEIANISFFVRTLMPESVAAEAMGVTTAENVFQGFWAAVKANKRFKAAQEIEDKGGMFEGASDSLRGASQSLGGAAYIGYRVTMIPADIHGIDTSLQATSNLGKAAYALGFVGNLLFSVFYLMIGVWAGYGVVKDWQFYLKLKAHEKNEAELFDFLINKLQVDPKSKLNKLKSFWETLAPEKKGAQIDAWKRKLSESALNQLTAQYLKAQEICLSQGKTPSKVLSEKEAKVLLKSLFDLQENALIQKGVRSFYLAKLRISEADLPTSLSTLECLGFILEENKRQQRHVAKFSRVANRESVEAVNKAYTRGLSQRLKSNLDPLVKESARKELAEIKAKVLFANEKNKWMHTALMIIGALGVISMVLTFLTLPPFGVTCLTVITLLLVAGMLVTDGYCMLESWESKELPGRYDKLYLAVVSFVLLAALGVSVGVTVGFGLPLTPLISAAFIAGSGFGLTAAAYYRMTKKEKQWLEDHPDLEAFKSTIEALTQSQDTEFNEKIHTLYKKLPKVDRQAIRQQFSLTCPNGSLKFKNLQFKALATRSNFGQEYFLDAVDPSKQLNAKEHQLLVQALKKTLKFFWDKALKTESEIDRQCALKLQELFERVRHSHPADLISNRGALRIDNQSYERLKNDLWFVFKRDESLQGLKSIVEQVIQNRLRSA